MLNKKMGMRYICNKCGHVTTNVYYDSCMKNFCTGKYERDFSVYDDIIVRAFQKAKEKIDLNKMEKDMENVKVEPKFTIKIYLDDGRIFYYDLESPEKVREHASAIIAGGYRHNDGNTFEHYPPHRILKVKCENIPTTYPDKCIGT